MEDGERDSLSSDLEAAKYAHIDELQGGDEEQGAGVTAAAPG